MLPCRPPGISDELWALELPSILGVAHSDFPDSPEPSSPSALPVHLEPGPEHPVSPRPGASPAGPHTTSHRHVPSTSSCEPHPKTSADVLLLDLSDTEEDHSPDTQVPAKLAVDSYDSEWNVPSPDLKLVFDLTAILSDLWHSPAPPTVLVAESQAYALLHQGYATFDDIDTLLDSLPGHQHAKRRKQQCEVGHPRQCSFSAGAFTFSFSTGIQRNTTSFPLVVQVLTSILRGACPGIQFSSLTIQRNVQVRMHTDKYNERDLESVIVPCSRWQGGSLWVQHDGGAHALDNHSGPGTMRRITWPYIRFQPHLRHATVPWSSGDQTILIGYTVKLLHRLSDADRHALHYRGFNLPPVSHAVSKA